MKKFMNNYIYAGVLSPYNGNYEVSLTNIGFTVFIVIILIIIIFNKFILGHMIPRASQLFFGFFLRKKSQNYYFNKIILLVIEPFINGSGPNESYLIREEFIIRKRKLKKSFKYIGKRFYGVSLIKLGNVAVKGRKIVDISSKKKVQVYKVQNNMDEKSFKILKDEQVRENINLLDEKENIIETLEDKKLINGLRIDEERQLNNLNIELKQFRKDEQNKTLFFTGRSNIEKINMHLNESIVIFHDQGKTILLSNGTSSPKIRSNFATYNEKLQTEKFIDSKGKESYIIKDFIQIDTKQPLKNIIKSPNYKNFRGKESNAKYLEKQNNQRISKVNEVKIISNKGSETYVNDVINNIEVVIPNKLGGQPLFTIDTNRIKIHKKSGKYEEEDKLFVVNGKGETTIEIIKTLFKD